MADRWDDRWAGYAPSKPLAAKDGIATSKTRGAMAETWWSKRFVDVLESFGLGGRMTRGRAYARKGQVLSLDVAAGLLKAKVQGSRPTPYAVTVRIVVPSLKQWTKIDDALRSRMGYAARLLAGEVPNDLEDVFSAAGSALFPTRWTDLRATCSCPDWGDPCKHQAALLYVFADQLDRDPWRLLAWHGRSRDDILALFTGHASTGDNAVEIAPWWPLRPGAGPAPGALPIAIPTGEPAIPAHAVLTRLGELDATANGSLVVDLLREAYRSA